MGDISKNFSYEEFTYSKTALDLGISNRINTQRAFEAIRALVNNVLQPLRDAWRAALYINSGFRCPALNAAVGGSKSSQHQYGEAADIKAPNPIKLAQLAYDLKLPFDQMIIYPTFVHFSHRLDGPQRGQVLYSKDYKGRHITLR